MDKWTWQEALDIYMAIEDFDGPNSSYHSTRGFVRTSPPALETTLSNEFITACEEMGIPRTADFNAPGGRYGAGYYHFNTRDGVRESAAKAFLGPMLDSKTAKSTRSNFQLMLDTTVTVSVLRFSLPIVSQAVLFSLMLVLRRSELDAYFTAITSKKNTNASTFGLFGSAGISAGAFLIPPGATLPEIQLTLFPRKSEPHMSNSAELNHVTEVIITIALLHPLARNRVVLVHDDDDSVDDNDSDDHLIPRVVSEVPEAKPEHLREGDVWKITWAIGVVREIAAKLGKAKRCCGCWEVSQSANTSELNIGLAAKGLVGREITPGSDVTSSKDLDAWVFNSVFRNTHWVGSASMAVSEDEGVVDNHLRVFGIKNLRVADASVIPLIPNGNVHSSVVMVANRAAQILREDEADYRRRHADHAK
ncbi:unnamed protein product [Phytophthora fragariaefolia]|uniref:Unnamed protein product n=1 Tax=Phytophthora fragariaefolia TaxID=1490495 RepID=A0A9W6X852_9STRA|nr:unnamed protein product [Phytophthora fragariaefolia]